MTKEISHSYHLDESIFILRGIGSNFSFLFHFSIKIISANRIASDGMPHFAASHLGLFCLPMSHKKDARVKSKHKIANTVPVQLKKYTVIEYNESS